ncbi:hypothetical protein FRX31_015481 [Thalictrum thalictroides]|uniref:Uncharacterized protein n=1 Tax=Thalictrum thalictroides TaxID=46969 RepID=A0A7J6WE91_THATH|nr:hypothetical protein FRX31_015481 [Thalictrum thalictroides]
MTTELSPVTKPQGSSLPANIPALAQVPHSQVTDLELQLHDNVFIFPTNPTLQITSGESEGEEEENHDDQHAMVTYGSDSEVIVKSKKKVPPLSILTRTRTQGQASTSKKSFSCCKDF